MTCKICNNETQLDFTKEEITIMKCSKCGFRQLDSFVQPDFDKDYYEAHREKISKDIMLDTNVKFIEKIINLTGKKTTALDIGCGDGLFLEALKTFDMDIYACDTSEHVIKTLLRQDLPAHLYCGTVEEFNCLPDFFDFVSMMEVIEHIEDPLKTLKEVNRIMKTNGILVIQTGNMNSVIAMMKGKNHPYYNKYHVSYFGIRSLKLALRLSGFKIDKIMPIEYSERAVLSQKFSAKAFMRLMAYKLLHGVGLMGGMVIIARKVSK